MNRLLLPFAAAAVLGLSSCDKANEAGAAAAEKAKEAASDAKSAAGGVMDKAKEATAGAMDKAKEAAAGAAGALKSAAQTAGGKLSEFAGAIRNLDYSNPAGLGDLGTKLESLNLDSLPDGVKSTIEGLKEPLAKIAEMVKTAPDNLKDNPTYQALVEKVKPMIEKLKTALGGAD